MFESKTVRPDRTEIRPGRVRQICTELDRFVRTGQSAIHALGRIGFQIVGAGAGAFIGIDYGAALLQPPLTGGADRAIDTPGTRRGCGHHTGVARIEALGYLGHDGYRHVTARHRHEGKIFLAGNPTFTGGAHTGAKEGTVSATGSRVDQGPVIVVDRQSPKFGGRWRKRFVKNWRRTDESGGAETSGQEIVGDAIVGGLRNIALDELGQRVEGGIAFRPDTRCEHCDTDQGAHHYTFHGRSLFVVVKNGSGPRPETTPMRVLCHNFTRLFLLIIPRICFGEKKYSS